MTIQEAITSGRSFKRKKHMYWIAIYDNEFFIANTCSKFYFRDIDILADDWEIKQ